MRNQNRTDRTEKHQSRSTTILVATQARSECIMQAMRIMLVVGILIVFPGKPVWASKGGFFVLASFSEISGGILLIGLCIAAFMFGLRLVLRSAITK
jgi:hypothetical protein